ncbi:hypothetical protein EMPS_06195 [Entomortierella parvispora]|uniref:Uncharacterized protein n=1 Tax=Entomortierella parvispora TaxID=205924 RepID=A0A9P3LX87_9FUNG|nr:hypothetical protein EMPS_06195 [Entomortierella parvispora]
MLSTSSLILLAVLAGSNHQGSTTVEAYQDAAHYFLPPNIYDNLPPGLTVPPGGPIQPPTTNEKTDTNMVAPSTSSLSPGPDASPTIDITAPALNTVYTPGTDLILTWSNNGILFPESWKPSQGLLDTIKGEPNFSNSPLLTEDDMTNLAKMKLEESKRTQLANTFKDSPIWLNSLRLVSWPASASSSSPSPSTVSVSPSILTGPGYSLLNVSRIAISGGSSGQLTWTIPQDWSYEGEFEIRVPSLFMDNDHEHPAKSRPFWILRDAATRASHPEYNTPLVLGPTFSSLISGEAIAGGKSLDEQHRLKQTGLILGTVAMMLAMILVGLVIMMGYYRRKWMAQLKEQAEEQANAAMTGGGGSGSGPLAIMLGDEDAHSPTDLNLSSVALPCSAKATEAVCEKENEVVSPSSAGALPLYEVQDSTKR